jgi:hypothetical protein
MYNQEVSASAGGVNNKLYCKYSYYITTELAGDLTGKIKNMNIEQTCLGRTSSIIVTVR